MVDKKTKWLFEGIPQGSRLGALLQVSIMRAEKRDPGLEPTVLKVKAINELNDLVGCQVEPEIFLREGTNYLRTEQGRVVARQMNQFVSRLETRRKIKE